MLKKTITFEDLDGNPITEDFYFNLSKAEIARMELSQHGGLSGHLKRIVEANDGAAIISTFEEILTKAYGLRGADNKTFEKSDAISRAFTQTDAYSVLFMELVTDADVSAAFIHGIIPASLAGDTDTPVLPAALLPITNVDLPPMIHSVKEPEKDPEGMTIEELRAAFRKNSIVD